MSLAHQTYDDLRRESGVISSNISCFATVIKFWYKESTGKKVEVVWTCDEKRRTLHRKEGDGNESTREKEERKT